MASGGDSDEPKTPEEPAAAVTESAAAAMTQKEDPEEPEPPAEEPEELPTAKVKAYMAQIEAKVEPSPLSKFDFVYEGGEDK